jgi:hypothetical protein
MPSAGLVEDEAGGSELGGSCETGPVVEGGSDAELEPGKSGVVGYVGNFARPQPNLIRWMAILHLSLSLDLGKRKYTAVAPPHCLFVISVPSGEHGCVSLQVEPSGIEYAKVTSVGCSTVTWKDSIENPFPALYPRLG